MDQFRVKFLGSVQVPYHKGNDVLCAAMQKIATTRRLTVHFNPPSSCVLEISVRGVKIGVKADDSQEAKVTTPDWSPALPPALQPVRPQARDRPFLSLL